MSFPNMLDTFKIDENSFITISTTLNEYRYIYNDLVTLDFDTNVLCSFDIGSAQALDSNMFSFLYMSTSKFNLRKFKSLYITSLESSAEKVEGSIYP